MSADRIEIRRGLSYQLTGGQAHLFPFEMGYAYDTNDLWICRQDGTYVMLCGDSQIDHHKSLMDQYVEDFKKPAINQYVETKKTELNDYTGVKKGELDTHTGLKETQLDEYTVTKKGDLDSYRNQKYTEIDLYVTNTSKVDIDNYVNGVGGMIEQITTHTNTKIGEISTHTTTKIGEITTHTDTKITEITNHTNTKKTEITDHTDTKKGEITSHTDTKKGELNTHTTTKEGQLDTYVEDVSKVTINDHTGVKITELNTHTTNKEGQLDTHTGLKITEITNHTTTKAGELDTHTDTKKGEITSHTNDEIIRLGQETGLDQKLEKEAGYGSNMKFGKYLHLVDYDDAESALTGVQIYTRDGSVYMNPRGSEVNDINLIIDGGTVYHTGNKPTTDELEVPERKRSAIGSSGGTRRYARLGTITQDDSHLSLLISGCGDIGSGVRGTYLVQAGTRREVYTLNVNKIMGGESDAPTFHYKVISANNIEIWGYFADYNEYMQVTVLSRGGSALPRLDSVTTTAPTGLVAGVVKRAPNADWADQVDVNTSTSTSFYNVLWHSGDTVYGANGKFQFKPSTGDVVATGYMQAGYFATSVSGTTNIDHIWHNDSDNSWNFCSDTTAKGTANSLIRASKVYNAVYNDYAEYFEAPKKKDGMVLDSGHIVMLDLDCEEDEDTYVICTEENSPLAVGVVSDEYGHIVGGKDRKNMLDNEEDHTAIGLAGRVRPFIVGAIKKGDFVVSSHLAGVGRKYIEGQDNPLAIIGMAVHSKETEEVQRVRMMIKN